MSTINLKLKVYAISLTGILLFILVGCSNSMGSAPTPNTPVTESPSVSTLLPKKKGTTEVFNYLELSVEITNVHHIKQASLSDGMETWEYDVFVVYPNAVISVLDASMSDPAYSVDGISQAQYGFLAALEDGTERRTKIIDGIEPIEITPDLVGIYNLESSTYVLGFEMYDEAKAE